MLLLANSLKTPVSTLATYVTKVATVLICAYSVCVTVPPSCNTRISEIAVCAVLDPLNALAIYLTPPNSVALEESIKIGVEVVVNWMSASIELDASITRFAAPADNLTKTVATLIDVIFNCPLTVTLLENVAVFVTVSDPDVDIEVPIVLLTVEFPTTTEVVEITELIIEFPTLNDVVLATTLAPMVNVSDELTLFTNKVAHLVVVLPIVDAVPPIRSPVTTPP